MIFCPCHSFKGEGWYADEGLASQEILHHIHVQAMNIN